MTVKKYVALILMFLSGITIKSIASTDDKGVYIGGQLGYSDSDFGNIYNSRNGGIGGRVYLGYQFNKYFALEGGYTRFADQKMRIYSDIGHESLSLHPESLDLSLKGILPLNDKISLYAKAGPAYLREQTVSSYRYSSYNNNNDPQVTTQSATWVSKENSAELAYGLGIEYKLTDNLSTDLSWLAVGIGHGMPNLASLGLSYHIK